MRVGSVSISNRMNENAGLVEEKIPVLALQITNYFAEKVCASIGKVFSKRCEKVTSTFLGSKFLSCPDSLIQYRTDISTILGVEMRNQFHSAWQLIIDNRKPELTVTRAQLPSVDFDERLVQSHKLFKRIVDRMKKDNQVMIASLVDRLNVLIPDLVIDEDNNPFDPENILSAFRSTLQEIDASCDDIVSLYRLFYAASSPDLSICYQKCNMVLAKKGYLPSLPHRFNRAMDDSTEENSPSIQFLDHTLVKRGVSSIKSSQFYKSISESIKKIRDELIEAEKTKKKQNHINSLEAISALITEMLAMPKVQGEIDILLSTTHMSVIRLIVGRRNDQSTNIEDIYQCFSDIKALLDDVETHRDHEKAIMRHLKVTLQYLEKNLLSKPEAFTLVSQRVQSLIQQYRQVDGIRC